MREILVSRATKSEIAMRSLLLRNGISFEFQKIIHGYIVDFLIHCYEYDLVVEIDGGVHNIRSVKKRDDFRQINIERHGYRFIRFSNEDVEDGNLILDALSNFDFKKNT